MFWVIFGPSRTHERKVNGFAGETIHLQHSPFTINSLRDSKVVSRPRIFSMESNTGQYEEDLRRRLVDREVRILARLASVAKIVIMAIVWLALIGLYYVSNLFDLGFLFVSLIALLIYCSFELYSSAMTHQPRFVQTKEERDVEDKLARANKYRFEYEPELNPYLVRGLIMEHGEVLEDLLIHEAQLSDAPLAQLKHVHDVLDEKIFLFHSIVQSRDDTLSLDSEERNKARLILSDYRQERDRIDRELKRRKTVNKAEGSY
jgi:hypothetical protein